VIPARQPPPRREGVRLLAVASGSGTLVDLAATDLPALFGPGDLLVVNDAATFPASVPARARGRDLELRLLGPTDRGTWRAVLFGEGDWRTPTEVRGPPPALAPGEPIAIAEHGAATVAAVSPISPRLIELRVAGGDATLWPMIYEHGRPVQYAHLERELALWDVQTSYASRPWAAEMPSAGRPLSWELLGALRRRGVALAALTHAAGLSSTGDPALDAALPLPERYDLPAATVAAIERADRVIAVGTTVVRALEGCALSHGRLVAGPGETDLRIGPDFRPRVVGGVLTGMHDPAESHYHLLRAFAPDAVLSASWRHAVAAGYRNHELGDLALLVPELPAWTSSSVTASRAPPTVASITP
jgi:S-adenosylmethionine:tRNA ribosyltransferase-isomerase